MADSCADCRFFVALDFGDGTCRRMPPLADNDGDGYWPTIHHDLWCGEFEQRLCGVEGCVLADGHADRWHRLRDGKLMQVLAMEEADG